MQSYVTNVLVIIQEIYLETAELLSCRLVMPITLRPAKMCPLYIPRKSRYNKQVVR